MPPLATKEIDAKLEAFKLAEHGDRNERLLWKFVGSDFPNYEILWRKYIIPLTFRLDSSLAENQRIRLRRGIKDFELFAMAHYSVFYYFGHATRRLESRHDEDLLAHDVFYLLDSSLDNLKLFYERLQGVGKLVGITFDRLVEPKKDKEFPELGHIAKYRDTLLHNPVPGRAIDQGVEKIAKVGELDRVKHSWMESEKLTEDQLIGTRKVLGDLRAAYGAYLNRKWEKILFRLDSKRDNYVRRMRLDIFVGPDADLMPGSTYVGFGVSGTNDFGTARSDTIQLPRIRKL